MMFMRKLLVLALILLFPAAVFGLGELLQGETTTTTFVSRFGRAMDNPPSEVRDLKIERIYDGGKNVRLTWTNPPEDDLAGVIIIVRADRYPEHKDDIAGEGKVLANLAASAAETQSYTHPLFQPTAVRVKYKDPNQYYMLVTYDRSNNFSRGVKGFLSGKVI